MSDEVWQWPGVLYVTRYCVPEEQGLALESGGRDRRRWQFTLDGDTQHEGYVSLNAGQMVSLAFHLQKDVEMTMPPEHYAL